MTDYLFRPSWAVAGAEVICIDTDNVAAAPGAKIGKPIADDITKGQKYIIESVDLEFLNPLRSDFGPYCGVHLVGVRTMPDKYSGLIVPFMVSRFRPIKTIEQDMEEHFKKLLKVDEPV